MFFMKLTSMSFWGRKRPLKCRKVKTNLEHVEAAVFCNDMYKDKFLNCPWGKY